MHLNVELNGYTKVSQTLYVSEVLDPNYKNQSKAMPSLLKRHKKEDFIPDPYCRVALLEKVSTKNKFH